MRSPTQIAGTRYAAVAGCLCTISRRPNYPATTPVKQGVPYATRFLFHSRPSAWVHTVCLRTVLRCCSPTLLTQQQQHALRLPPQHVRRQPHD